MKRKIIYGLSVCVIGLSLVGCESLNKQVVEEVVDKNTHVKEINKDNYNNISFSSEEIEYVFDITKEDLIKKFGEKEFETTGITTMDVKSKIYGFNDGNIVAAVSDDSNKVVVLNLTDDSIDHIKDIKIGDSLNIAISKIFDGLEFNLDTADKVLEWDGGYYIGLFGDIDKDSVHDYLPKEPVGYAVYQDFSDGFTQVVLRESGIEIVINITENKVDGITYSLLAEM